MTEPVGPALARHRLSTYLRGLRADQPAADVAGAMHWSLSKLNRIENNKVTIQPVEVQALLAHYGVDDRAEIDRLIGLSLASRQRMWWRDQHFAEDYTNFIAFENDAARLLGYQAMFVPPLFQTPEYAHAVTGSVLRLPVDHPDVQTVVNVRLKRQETMRERLAGDFPPSISQAIDESVLLRPVGGAEVMAAQLDHLLEWEQLPTVHTVVVPLRIGVHPGLGGTFELLTFSEDEDLDVVFLESQANDLLLTDKQDTAIFRNIMDDLFAVGVGVADAVDDVRQSLAVRR
ncbi:MAG: helix-turn-helix transcriptional regulator [Actinoplanes sp.]